MPDRLLLGAGHQRLADGLHPVERPAEGAGHRHVAAHQRHRRVGAVHLHDLDLGGVDAEMLERPEQLVVGDVAGRRRHLLALELLGVRLGDAAVVADDAEVVLGIGDGDADELQRGAVGDADHEGHEAVAVGDVDVARDHRLVHLGAGAEGAPLDLDAELLVVGLVHLGDLVRRRPFEEVGHRHLVLRRRRAGGQQRRPCQRAARHRRLLHSPHLPVVATIDLPTVRVVYSIVSGPVINPIVTAARSRVNRAVPASTVAPDGTCLTECVAADPELRNQELGNRRRVLG